MSASIESMEKLLAEVNARLADGTAADPEYCIGFAELLKSKIEKRTAELEAN